MIASGLTRGILLTQMENLCEDLGMPFGSSQAQDIINVLSDRLVKFHADLELKFALRFTGQGIEIYVDGR